MYCNNDIDYLHFLMDKQVYIFGAGIIGRRLFAGIKKAGCNVEAFIDNEKRGTYCEKPIIKIEQYQKQARENAFIVISSYKYENTIKMQLMDQRIYNFISASQIDFGGGGKIIMMRPILFFKDHLVSLAERCLPDYFHSMLQRMMFWWSLDRVGDICSKNCMPKKR